LSSNKKHLGEAKLYLYVREIKPNRSPEIDKWNRYVRNALGSPYCAAFIGYNIRNVHEPRVRSGLARHYYTKAPDRLCHTIGEVIRGEYKPKAGDLVVWARGSSVQGHIGFVLYDWTGTSGWTLEANTSAGKGSQYDGNGVFKRYRKIEPYNFFRIIGFVEVIE
jgi:hypothetical protein